MQNPFATHLSEAKEWFDRSTRCLTEEDSAFRPTEALMTTAQQVAHVAQTVDWFIEGAFRPEGFNMDFEGMMKEVMATPSLKAARQWLDEAFARAIAVLETKTQEELAVLLPADGIMGGAPRLTIVGAIADHTAHHRGVLTVYSRLRGHTPAMPYMEM